MTKTSTTKKTNSKAIELLIRNEIWLGAVDSFYGKEKCKILNIANNEKDSNYLIANKYNVSTISPEKLNTLEPNNQYDIAIATYLNKQIKDEYERNNFLYQINERIFSSGFIFLSVTKSSGIEYWGETFDVVMEHDGIVTYII